MSDVSEIVGDLELTADFDNSTVTGTADNFTVLATADAELPGQNLDGSLDLANGQIMSWPDGSQAFTGNLAGDLTGVVNDGELGELDATFAIDTEMSGDFLSGGSAGGAPDILVVGSVGTVATTVDGELIDEREIGMLGVACTVECDTLLE